MKVENHVRIQLPIDQVWQIIAVDFAHIQDWMSDVRKSEALTDVPGADNAPVAGRFCQLSDDPEGLCARETITRFDAASHQLEFVAVPVNAPALLPLTENRIEVSLVEIGPEETEVRWTAAPALKTHGYLMYPMLKLGLSRGFQDLLSQLKAFAEQQVAA